MTDVKFQFAKLLNTVGFKSLADNIWNRAEADLKKKKWGSSSFQNTFLIEQGLLANKLEPKKELIESLAEDQIYARAENFFDVFGFVSLRGMFKENKLKLLDKNLRDLRSSSPLNKTLYYTPIEKSRDLQDILLCHVFFNVISKIIGPFWYGGSDAAVESKPFPLHRDTFFNPPVIKILIPTEPGTFQILCGSHHAYDEFSRNAGSFICDWDRPSNMSSGSSSVYFQVSDNSAKVVGYDDCYQNPPITNIPLNPGDVFIFNQNLVHGLQPVGSTVSFVAFSVFPSPENARKFKMDRLEHLDNIIKSNATMILVEQKYAGSKNIDQNEIVYPGQAFAEEDLSRLIQNKKLKDYFGLFDINYSTWQTAIRENCYGSMEMLKKNL